MKLKRNQKGVLSLVVAFAMLSSTVGTAAASEPINQDARSNVVVDTEPEPTLVMTEAENKEETESETEGETKEETEVETEEETEEETEPETEEETEEETEPETEEETEEETEPETEEETKEKTEEETEEETKEETESGTEEETEEDDLLEAPNDKSPGEFEPPVIKPPVTLIPDVHEHSWSEGWYYDENYHWHECEAEDCPVTEDSEKDGYGEHSYNEYGVCIDCGHAAPDVHEHSWSEVWYCDESYHWHECREEGCPITDNSEKDGYGEHTFDDYNVCIDCGYDAMGGIAVVMAGDVPTYREAYEAMIALKGDYPEGMTWTNEEPFGTKGQMGDSYTWNGGSIYGARSAVGCMAFAFILSDTAFNNLPARAIARGSFTFEDVKVGDILRVNGNSHSVIVLQKSASGVVVAEANYNKSVHWGRVMSAAEVTSADYIITRYPVGYISSDAPEADEEVAGGKAGTLDWSLTKSGVLTISGNGAIPDYSASNPSPWSSGNVDTVIIEKGVTGIGNYAFYKSQALSVYIPDSVTKIGQYAFNESAVMAVTIPGSVKTIGDNAFRDCANLTSATVSEGVTTIGDNAFRGCTALTHIDFPASITSVGSGAFMSCSEMVSVRFMPGSGTATLGSGLFAQCQSLTVVTLPQTADCISDDMFQSCTSLPSLYIPASVQKIGENPFTSCKFLKVIYFGGSEAEWNSIEGVAFLKGSLQSTGTTVEYNVEFDDPFAADPNDPGDFHPGESESCTNHVDADNDGKCDNCGAAMTTNTPEPDEGDDKTEPDDSEKNPSGSVGGNNPPTTGGPSNGSSDSSNDSSSSDNSSSSSSDSSSSDSSSSSSESSGSGRPVDPNPTISTTIKRNADGSSVVTKTQKDGTVTTITTDAAGNAEMEVKLSALAVNTAEQSGKAITLPTSAVQAVRDVAMAPAITVYTEKEELVKVAVPAVSPTPGTVAVIVNADGSTEVIKNSVPTENSIVVSLANEATIKIVDNSKSFSDVPAEAWFEDAVAFVSARDLFYGTTETTFAPGEPMTYAALMTALARFDGAETDGGTTWYTKSMEWAAVRGMNDGTNPGRNVTGEQLVTILWKYAGSPAAVDTLSNADASQISSTQEAMRWAAETGIVSGFEGDGTLDLQRQVNRAEAAQIIMNFAKKLALNSVQ